MATTASWLIIMVGLVTGLLLIQHDVDVALDDLKETTEEWKRAQTMLKNTDFEISSAFYNNTTSALRVNIKNSGSEVIPIAEVVLLVDGVVTSFNVSGGSSSSYIYPGESVTLISTLSGAPSRVRVVVSWGVARTINNIRYG
ncbi:MAG: hypothetical protein DRN42_01595 [Thermoplasmata archaeon]|nr:MAG: hypothetical protein DRN42_01595 [Thermoplasmata archaeon]